MEFVQRAYDLDVIERRSYLQLLAFSGNLDKLKAEHKKEEFPPGIGFAAALGDHQKILEWLEDEDENMNHVMHCAAQLGNIKILEWGLSNGLELDETCMYRAARDSNAKTIQWLIDHKCPMNGSAYIGALSKHNLNVLDFLFEQVHFEPEIEIGALEDEVIPSLDWLWAHGHEFGKEIGMAALIEKKLKVLQWLEKKTLLDIPDELMSMVMLRDEMEQQ